MTVNCSGREDILRHFAACDASFDPPLSVRVNLSAYAEKLADHATRFEIWAGEDLKDSNLIGLVAVYCNAPDRLKAFISNVSVIPDHTGQGIARRLMEAALVHLRARGFTKVELEVSTGATAALGLYKTLGFLGDEARGQPLRKMILWLR